MKRTLILLAATVALSVSAAHATEPAQQAKAKAKTEAAAKAEAKADAESEGVVGKVKGWFNNDEAADSKEAEKNAKTAPAAGESKKANKQAAAKKQPSQKNTTANKAPSANDTNPVVGRVLTEGGADIGIRTNAQIGGGAGGSYGNN